MFKLILVDDESEVREGMINKMDFKSLGFDFVGEAENGVEALELIEQEKPDLAIIDIKMPYMNGIQLAQICQEKFPALRVIILSGFDEFEYAQKAIQYNVLDYVLKPISSNDFSDLLKRTYLKLEDEKFKNEDLERYVKHYYESLPIIRDRFLSALVLEKHSIQNLEDKIERYGIQLGEGPYEIAIVRPDQNSDITSLDADVYSYAISQTIVKTCEERQVTTFHNHNGDTIIIIPKEESRVFQLLEEIRATIEKIHVVTVTIGLGEKVQKINSFPIGYETALTALNYSLFEGHNKVIWIQDIELDASVRLIFDGEEEQKLNHAIRANDQVRITKLLDELFEQLNQSTASVGNYKRYIRDMLNYLMKLSYKYDLKIDWFVNHEQVSEYVNGVNDTSTLENLIRKLALEISNGIQSTRKNAIKLLIDKAAVIIDEGYSNSDMSLDYVAGQLHLSSEYLSRQFKKEKAITFIQYLTQVRMNKAKALIDDTNYKNFEVAEAVGYSEANYFSYAFKKYFGISPSKYRKSVKS